MGKKFDKVKEFVKEHKAEIIAITVGAGVGTILCIAACKSNQKQKIKLDAIKKASTEILGPQAEVKQIGIGTAIDEYVTDKNVLIWVDDLNIDDVGVLGEKLREAYPNIPEHHDKVQVEINAWDLGTNE